MEACLMPYGASPLTDNSDAVRVLVGDVGTSTSTTWLDDAEYDYFLSIAPNNLIAAQHAAISLAAVFAGPSGAGEDWVERKVGDLTIKRSEATGIAAEFRALSKEYARKAAAGITPFAGGISMSDKSDVEADTDRVRPAFTRKLFDSPYVIDAAGGTSST